MKHVVSFSGGMGSFAEAEACVNRFGKDNTILLFANVNIEDEDLYRFVKETVDFLGCEFVELNNGKTPFDVFKQVRFMGNTRIDPCSDRLKRGPLNKWLTSTFTPDQAEMHLGIDFSESHRLVQVKQRMAPYVYRSTLVEDERIISKDFSEQFGIRRPRLYDWRLGHNNCGGFCVKAGLGHYAALYAAAPERYKQIEAREQDVYASVPNARPFLRKRVDGVLKYITLRQYREDFLESNQINDEEKFEFGGCGCAI